MYFLTYCYKYCCYIRSSCSSHASVGSSTISFHQTPLERRKKNKRGRNRVKKRRRKQTDDFSSNLKGSHFLPSTSSTLAERTSDGLSTEGNRKQRGETLLFSGLLSMPPSTNTTSFQYTRLWKWVGTSDPTAFIAYSEGARTTHSGY